MTTQGRLKVLHVTYSFLPAFGGQENCILSLALRHARDWSVHILANHRALAMHGDTYQVHRLLPLTPRLLDTRPSLGRPYFLAQLAWAQAVHRFDVWHTHFTGEFGQAASEFAIRRGIPCVWGVHGIGCLRDLKGYLERRRDLILAAAPGKLVVDAGSRFLADEIRSYGYPRSSYIPRGCDHELFRRVPAAKPAGTHRLRLIAIARNVPDKRLSVILQAMARLAGAGQRDIGLTLVTHEVEALRAFASQNGITDTVRLLRTQDLKTPGQFCLPPEGVIAEIKAADCMVSMSRYEASPNVIIEAYAAGIPVVVSDIPAHREMVRDGVDGLFVPGDDPAALASQLLRLRDEQGLRDRLAAGARESAARYDWDRTAAEYARLYREAIAAR